MDSFDAETLVEYSGRGRCWEFSATCTVEMESNRKQLEAWAKSRWWKIPSSSRRDSPKTTSDVMSIDINQLRMMTRFGYQPPTFQIVMRSEMRYNPIEMRYRKIVQEEEELNREGFRSSLRNGFRPKIEIGIRGLGLGLDNSLLNVVWHAHYFVSQLFNEVELGHSI